MPPAVFERLKPMNPEELQRLRDLMLDVQPSAGEGLPHPQIASLASALEGVGAVTIDYAAVAHLGHPIVVVRDAPTALAGLSARETEVAQLVAEGLTNKEIARRLCISLATTKEHVHNILGKTGLPNRAAIAAAVK